MAVADQPSALMDIASSLTQDEIPFKLRCAICNKLAVNAFRLPCCDQAICENCQASLPESCPVCAHTPISPDLCKPNKALRTTLKAFLRTEEKKREKERSSATPATPAADLPVDTTHSQAEAQTAPPPVDQADAADQPVISASDAETRLEEQAAEVPQSESTAAAVAESNGDQTEAEVEKPQDQNGVSTAEGDAGDGTVVEGDTSDQTTHAVDTEQAEGPQQENMQFPGAVPNAMGFDMSNGGFPNMGWNGTGDFNPMAQFMPGGMFNFQNSMGMPGMAMDPMAASQGMFGGYGMNMNGMSNGMNMGMNFNAGQGMYGSWDGSQNNMWNGGPDKFNPNAFANGMGPEFGGPSGFGGYNHGNYQMQQQFPNQDFQNGFYGPGYGRGGARGRGRGFFQGGRGRGGFGGYMQANYPTHANPSVYPNQQSPSVQQQNGLSGQQDTPNGPGSVTSSVADNKKSNDELATTGENEFSEDQTKDTTDEAAGDAKDVSSETKDASASSTDQPSTEEPELRGIPTIDSIEQPPYGPGMAPGFTGFAAPTGPGFGRGGFPMRGGYPGGRGGAFMNGLTPGGHQPIVPNEPRGQGVAGAPAAPRAMREGFPNTGIRGRGFHIQGRASLPLQRSGEDSRSVTPATRQGESQAQSKAGSRSPSRARERSGSRSRSRSRSPSRQQSRGHHHRRRSESIYASDEDRERRRERHRKKSRRDDEEELRPVGEKDTRSRSRSLESTRRSHRRDRDIDRDRDRHRSHRSHRHRSRSRSADRKGESRHHDQYSVAPEENGASSREKTSLSGEPRDLTTRISSSYRSGKERSSRREDERESRHHDRDRDRDRERNRDRDRPRDGDRDRDRERGRDRDREKDRKRSRRDRSESPADSEYSRHHSRRTKRHRDDSRVGNRDRNGDKAARPTESEKDPHTLEREARNRERLLKEQQRREAMIAERDGKNGRRRESRPERGLTGGRRLSYKYEDEESDRTRAARIEEEREAARWD
ncbi:hypothetical protein DTO027B5_3047 [Paecilomyces variotii]|nr:hypothetical protein DTO195F2_3852 [Paecilomyces variotii]KAJ9285832.1 hypothetical protein DTO021C3_6541 [Paecilomyces variotii]KAJ9321314.1 hypothetical protein DTO027B3_7693 [Paecilomyces variotii]KAJ9335084.1 hypothetical protein DTO027B5_3047 [Paecilomyces variotii]KAJ9369343.1 hypothetical protein DTO282E5_6005 [Paecilomyces variotii]